MAEATISDLLMKFVELDDNPIEGDAMTVLPKNKGAMLKGFDEKHMFEVQSFSFKTGLGGQEIDKQSEEQQKAAEKTNETLSDHAEMLNGLSGSVNNLVELYGNFASVLNGLGESVKTLSSSVKSANSSAKGVGSSVRSVPTAAIGVDATAKPVKTSSTKGFLKFRAGKMTADTRYPVDMKPVEFERTIDRTSGTLLHHCINRIPFKSATLVKRRAAGGSASGEVFLRFDFNTVLIKSIDWDDGTPVKEKVEFICRAVTIHYRPQLPDGSLGFPIPAFWKASDNSKIEQENLNSST